MTSLSELTRALGTKSAPKPVEAEPPRVRPAPTTLERITVLLSPVDVSRADQLWSAQGFRSRHHLLQWLILHGLRAMEEGNLRPERRISRIVEVQKP